VPTGASGLLATPQYYNTATCNANNNPATPTTTCNGVGFSPSFDPTLPSTDVKVRARLLLRGWGVWVKRSGLSPSFDPAVPSSTHMQGKGGAQGHSISRIAHHA
jgi:hypothetical protein